MNVYELADALEKIETYNQVIHRSFNDKTKLTASADMLRKQADRIAELEKSHIELEKGIVADLNKRQSAKPVAWMDYLEHSDVYDLNVSGRGIPLYTTPQIKELSDEEILNVAFCCEVNTVAIENDWDGTVIDFAKAILKKASER